MTGAIKFVEKNFKRRDITFDNCLHAIIYGFGEVQKDRTYSRKKILEEASRIRSKNASIIELEDYLRNDLVINYIQPNLDKFNLKNYLFIPGADEIANNIRTGMLDIKVCSPSFNGNVYYVFECKRFNKSIIGDYLKEGIQRFTKSKYYPEAQTSIAGLISFLESVDIKKKVGIEDVFEQLKLSLNNSKVEIKLKSELSHYRLKSKKYNFISEYKFVFQSVHGRENKKDIELVHVMLDYNNLVKD